MKKLLLIGGLTLIFLGAIYSGIYSGFYLPGLKRAEYTLFKEGLKMSSESPTTAQKIGGQFMNKVFFDGKMSNVHSHAMLFGLMALAIGQYVTRFRLPDWALWLASWMLLLSGVILPLGVFIETWKVIIGGVVALVGGCMFILAIMIFLTGAVRSSKLKDD